MFGRVIAGVGVVATAGSIVALNVYAAKIRELATTGGGLLDSMQLSKVMASDWSMTPAGLAVLSLGMANAAFAWWKGYHVSDP